MRPRRRVATQTTPLLSSVEAGHLEVVPQPVGAVGDHGGGETSGRPVERAEARRVGADPQQVAGSLGDVPDVAVTEAERVVGIGLPDAELTAVVAIQTVLSGQPHEALLVLQDVVDGALGEPLFDGQVTEGGLEHETGLFRMRRA